MNWEQVEESMEGSVKQLVNGLIDDSIAELNGPIRNIAGRLTMAAQMKRMDLVEESTDQLLAIALEKKLKLKSGGSAFLQQGLNLGMTMLVNGAIAALSGVKL